MKTATSTMFAAGAICLLLNSCAMNPLAYGYRSVPGLPKRETVNPSPILVETSMSAHNSSVNRYLARGYYIVGYGQISERAPIDAQNARMLAIEKKADAAIFSRENLGKRSETVRVPVATATSSGYSTYANSNYYRSASEGGSQTTIYRYQDHVYQLWRHKTTLLRK